MERRVSLKASHIYRIKAAVKVDFFKAVKIIQFYFFATEVWYFFLKKNFKIVLG